MMSSDSEEGEHVYTHRPMRFRKSNKLEKCSIMRTRNEIMILGSWMF